MAASPEGVPHLGRLVQRQLFFPCKLFPSQINLPTSTEGSGTDPPEAEIRGAPPCRALASQRSPRPGPDVRRRAALLGLPGAGPAVPRAAAGVLPCAARVALLGHLWHYFTTRMRRNRKCAYVSFLFFSFLCLGNFYIPHPVRKYLCTHQLLRTNAFCGVGSFESTPFRRISVCSKALNSSYSTLMHGVGKRNYFIERHMLNFVSVKLS